MQPRIEKYPHEFGQEYAWVFQQQVLGSVMPICQPVRGQRNKWRAIVDSRVVGIYTGKVGRFNAMSAVKHFTKHKWVNQ